MGRLCCILGCVNRKNKQKVSFFSIPSPRNNKGVEVTLKRRRHEAWLKAIGRTDLTGTKLQHASVCSIHFIRGAPSAEDYDRHPDWVPSLFLKSQDINKEKYKRSLKKMEEFKREKDKQRRNLLQSFAGEQDSILMKLLLSSVKGYENETLIKKNNELGVEEYATGLTVAVDNVERKVEEEFEMVVVKKENEPKIEEFDTTILKKTVETKVKVEDISIAPANEENSETILGI